MKYLVTADFQADWAVLDLCTQAWKQILEICKEQKLNGIIVAGDAKHKYNPVDIRVIKWWLWAIKLAKKKGLRVILLLGNHDRIGLHSDAQNWFPILRKAGAWCIDKPEILEIEGDDGKLMMLPFMSSVAEWKKAARELASKANPEKDVLLFHADLKNCRYNQTGERSDARTVLDDLDSDRYLVCIGGHVHLGQQLGERVYYVGSPYCTDWGESNQQKRYLVIDGSRVRSVASRIAGWFTVDWPAFNPEMARLPGARIRAKVKCESNANYDSLVEKKHRELQRRFPKATIFVIPSFEHGEGNEQVRVHLTDPDSKKICIYVKETIPAGMEVKPIVAYLDYRLRQVGGALRTGQAIRFTKIKAQNFLSFKEVEFDYRSRGLVVVRGVNADMSGSNGAGKTNFLQAIPVALFGTTFKGQKFDRWARRGSEEESSVRVYFRDARERKVYVLRGRKPSRLELRVNGEDQSSGNSRGGGDTQELIQTVSGFTWQTLANAVYIDQSVTQAFLSGTRKDRTEILSRFQNLERFEKALKIIRRDEQTARMKKAEIKIQLEYIRDNIADCNDSIQDERKRVESALANARGEFTKAEKAWVAAKKELERKKIIREHIRKKLAGKVERVNERITVLTHSKDKLEKEKLTISGELARLEKIKNGCPVCGSRTSTIILKRGRKKLRKKLIVLIKQTEDLRNEIRRLENHSTWVEGKYDHLAIKTQEEEGQVKSLEDKADWLAQKAREEESDEKKIALKKLIKKSKKLQVQELISKRYLKELIKRIEMLEYCGQAFSRDGIPAFLNAQLVPTLNKAAEHYSELFCDKAIQVRFETVDGEFEPRIINAAGGEQIEDQSRGEKTLAGLITSFALREIAPACNLLVLDEPGEGLDAQNSRQFAKALKTLKKKFGTVIITSHNQNILSELEGEQVITIKKERGVSRII